MEKVIAQLNEFTTKVMTSFRYCRKVYDGGFDSDYAAEQFATFMNLCQSHVNLCNSLCKKVKPRFKFFQWSKYKMYKAFRDTCAYTVEEIQAMINEKQAEFDKIAEIEELRETMAIKAQIDYELACEFKELDIERNKNIRESRNIGFTYNEETAPILGEDYEEYDDNENK